MLSSGTSAELISDLKLIPHPEGGYFVVTDEQKETIPSPFAEGKERLLATSIYYFLSYERPRGYLHMNKSVIHHVLHEGRAEYTFITPGNPPKIEKHILGTNAEAGETRFLVLGTGVWKMSRLLDEDLKKAENDPDVRDRTHCLITEVVVPGFHWEDHQYLTAEGLKELFSGVEGGEALVEEYSKYLKPEA
ncbi:hypothetical protein AX16_002171 [Volvariella volvacea WC 439]|nr:hypothetical protein AX16_002171 [Volvariella volvacea WC 439]